MFGDLGRAVALIDSALGWMAEHHIGAHHHAFDTLITGAWCRLSVGDVLEATALAERAWADADALGCAWNQLQAGYLGARLALVTGDPVRCLHLVDELREVIPFEVCRPYADRLVGVEVEGLAAVGRTLDAARTIEALEPGPPALLLRARLQGSSDRDVDDLLAPRATWPVLERIQAELVLNVRSNGSVPSDELVELVKECGTSGWVLPFLGLGPRIERLLRSTRLARAHPQLARTLDYLAPADPIANPDRAGVRLTSRELSLVELLPTHLSYAEIGARLLPVGQHGEVEPEVGVPQARRHDQGRGGRGEPPVRAHLRRRRPGHRRPSRRGRDRPRLPLRLRPHPVHERQNCHTSGTRSTETTPNSNTSGRPSFQ